ncbi:HAMP domain-containing sensor histidine kinase [Halobacteriovorax sp. HLS]|uniref:sensor histidine kinase n=1 Tax=Halobacteriovorax sp. HLS TaxID=2234000 RepID=UPI000FD71857|nr:ATP-binding protein [Halobacteriovorax sp. HLS]
MKQQLQSWFSKKKTIAGIGATALLIFSGVFQHQVSTKVSNLKSMQAGLSTCFSRVNQSYTAKVIGDASSMYLESGFMKTTEECFSETNAFFEKEVSAVAGKISQSINALMTDVNWFHERVEESSSSFSDQSGEIALSNLSDRFEKLEIKFDQLEGDVISKVEGMSLSKENLNLFLIVLSILAPLLLLWDFVEKKKLQQKNNQLEVDARRRLENGDAIVHAEVGNIIKEALEQNQLVYCSELFSQFHALNPVADISTTKMRTIDLETPVLGDSKLDAIWLESEMDDSKVLKAEGEVPKYKGPVTGLDQVLSKVVDHLSNKLLADGVMIDLDIKENINVQGESEALEQVIYNVVMNAVKNCQSSDSSNRISINAKRVGSSVCVNLTDSGVGFSRDFLTAASGLGDIDEHMPLALKISSELVEDVNGTMSFENLYTNSEVVGSKVQIVLKHVEVEQKRVASIQKGTKKEILAAIQEQVI